MSYSKTTGKMTLLINERYSEKVEAGLDLPQGGKLVIGGDGASVGMYKGQISCFRVFSKVLTKEDMIDRKDCSIRESLLQNRLSGSTLVWPAS